MSSIIEKRIVITFKDDARLPDVKFYGAIKPRDLQQFRIATQRAYRTYIRGISKRNKEEAKKEAVSEQSTVRTTEK